MTPGAAPTSAAPGAGAVKENVTLTHGDMSLPLISIIILTYNSSRFIVETLESARRQTYAGPIELIITDDLSRDDTLQVCRDWLAENAERFSRVEILETPENTGVPKNCNRGCRSARGEWIKLIAGDDILADDCLETLYGAACERGESCKFLFSSVWCFRTGQDISQPETLEVMDDQKGLPFVDMEYAYKNSVFWICAPTFFYSRRMLETLGYYPEDFRNVEDAPFIRKVLGAGYTLYHVDRPTVFYRLSESSITTNYSAMTGMVQGEVQLVSIDRYLRPALSGFRSFRLYWRLIFLRLYVATKLRLFWRWHCSLEKLLNGQVGAKKKKKKR